VTKRVAKGERNCSQGHGALWKRKVISEATRRFGCSGGGDFSELWIKG